MIDAAFWKGKRVFITGHTGFKGTWLSLWLHNLGARVTGYALAPPSNPNMYEVVGLESAIDSVAGSVCDEQRLREALAGARPEIVIHMAAQSLVGASYRAPVETYRTNVLGTVNLLDAVRTTQCARAVIVVTSDKCYEDHDSAWGYREDDRLGGYDPYSSSKACAELVTTAYTLSFFHPKQHGNQSTAVASVRAGNVIGGGDWAADRLIPDIVRSLDQRCAVGIRNASAVRPWQHVLEPLSGYLLLAKRLVEEGPEFAEAWNFGPAETDARAVAWVTDRFLQLWNDGIGWKAGRAHLHEAKYLRLDCSKAMQRLRWRPRWDIEKALAESVRWYKAHAEGADMRKFTLQQIDQYQRT